MSSKEYVMNVKKTAERLRKLRKEKNLSYSKLAEKLVDKYSLKTTAESLMASLKKYEADENNVSYGSVGGMATNTLYMLADYYEVSVDYLLGKTNFPSVDDKLKEVHKLTGLSTKAIKTLKLWLERSKDTEENQYIYETYKRSFEILNYLLENDLEYGFFIDLVNFLLFKKKNKELIELNRPIVNDDLSYTSTIEEWEALTKVKVDKKLYSIKEDIEEDKENGKYNKEK